jgi:CDP-diacylglycerol--serine O-phosphatidyltransferase
MTGIIGLVRLPDAASILNASLGYASILAASEGRLAASAARRLLAMAADGLDGFLARRLGDGPLGVQIDSLADAVSFGAAPAYLAWSAFGSDFGSAFSILGPFYLACGILRLARFNVTGKKNGEFQGMPIPGAGAFVAASIFLDGPLLTAFLMVSMSLLMISTIPYPKLRDPRFVPPVLAVGAASAAAWHQGDLRLSAGVVFLALIGYLISPVVIDVCRRRGKRPPSRRG